MTPSSSGITNPFPWVKSPKRPDGSLPAPARVYGALRSGYIHRHSDFHTFYEGKDPEIKRWMGTPEKPGDFSIRAVWLYDAQGAVLPLPLDYQVVRAEKGEQALPLVLCHEKEKGDWASDGSEWRLYASENKKSASPADAYLGENEWRERAAFHQEIPSIARVDRWLAREPKIGIARDNLTMRVREGMLYQLPMHRFKEEQGKGTTGLLVLCDQAPSFDDVRYVLLGGEGNPGISPPSAGVQSFVFQRGRRETDSTDPGTGKGPHHPAHPRHLETGHTSGVLRQRETQELDLGNNLRVKLLTAAVGRPLVIGGWDMKKNRPKKRQYAVPAGSVLIVKVNKEQAEQLVRTVHSMKLTDELEHEGYGCAVCGAL